MWKVHSEIEDSYSRAVNHLCWPSSANGVRSVGVELRSNHHFTLRPLWAWDGVKKPVSEPRVKIFSAKLDMILPQSGVCILKKKKTKKDRSTNSLSERRDSKIRWNKWSLWSWAVILSVSQWTSHHCRGGKETRRSKEKKPSVKR